MLYLWSCDFFIFFLVFYISLFPINFLKRIKYLSGICLLNLINFLFKWSKTGNVTDEFPSLISGGEATMCNWYIAVPLARLYSLKIFENPLSFENIRKSHLRPASLVWLRPIKPCCQPGTVSRKSTLVASHGSTSDLWSQSSTRGWRQDVLVMILAWWPITSFFGR